MRRRKEKKNLGADALITKEKKVWPIGVLTADCVPIINLYDEKNKLISSIHCWLERLQSRE